MAPLAVLLAAASGRSESLGAEGAKLEEELAAVDKEVNDKRAEKTIAAQEAVKDLLKRREALQKKARLLEAAAGHVRLALAKLQRAQAAGLQDWRELREERLKLSDFAVQRLKEKEAMAGLEAASGGGTLAVEGTALVFTGNAASLPALKAAVDALESGYSVNVEVEADMLRLLETRGELKRMGEKHGAELSSDGNGVSIAGAVEGVKKAEKALKWLLSGKADLTCPRELFGACKAQAKDLEAATGALVEVVRGGFGGGGIVHIRGNSECVQEAEEQLRNWLDEREGAYSAFVEIREAFAKLSPEELQQFNGDLGHFGRKFGISAWAADGQIELRGPAGGDWEAPARAELKQIVDFYAPPAPAPKKEATKAKAKPKAKAPEPVEEEDGWGAAPEADFELGHKW